MRRGSLVAAVIGLIFLCAPLVSRHAAHPPGAFDAGARELLALARAHDMVHLLARAGAGDSLDRVRAAAESAGDFLARFPVDSARLIGWSVARLKEVRGELTYELHVDSLWGLFAVDLTQRSDGFRLDGFRWHESAGSLGAANAFTLRAKSPTQWAYLSLAVLAAAAAITAALAALVGGMEWWWVIAGVVGLARFSVNWTTGVTSAAPTMAQLLAAGASRSGPVGPWIISFSVPVGAIAVFAALYGRRHPRRRRTDPPARVNAPGS